MGLSYSIIVLVNRLGSLPDGMGLGFFLYIRYGAEVPMPSGMDRALTLSRFERPEVMLLAVACTNPLLKCHGVATCVNPREATRWLEGNCVARDVQYGLSKLPGPVHSAVEVEQPCKYRRCVAVARAAHQQGAMHIVRKARSR